MQMHMRIEVAHQIPTTGEGSTADFELDWLSPSAIASLRAVVRAAGAHASPALVGGNVYTFGREGNDEVIRCLDAATGKCHQLEKLGLAEWLLLGGALHLDDGPGAGTYKEARVVGYETMSAFATGTNLFPTAAQMANGAFVRKSATADATARAWYLIADERTFYCSIAAGDAASTYLTFGFGEIYSLKGVSDSGRMFLMARNTENITTTSLNTFDSLTTPGTTQTGSYLARDTAGSVGAILFGRVGDSSSGVLTEGEIAFKNAADNKIYLAPLRVTQAVGGIQIRGRMRGAWHWCHPDSACSDRDTITGSGDLAGKTFVTLKANANGGIIVYETSDTWETN